MGAVPSHILTPKTSLVEHTVKAYISKIKAVPAIGRSGIDFKLAINPNKDYVIVVTPPPEAELDVAWKLLRDVGAGKWDRSVSFDIMPYSETLIKPSENNIGPKPGPPGLESVVVDPDPIPADSIAVDPASPNDTDLTAAVVDQTVQSDGNKPADSIDDLLPLNVKIARAVLRYLVVDRKGATVSLDAIVSATNSSHVFPDYRNALVLTVRVLTKDGVIVHSPRLHGYGPTNSPKKMTLDEINNYLPPKERIEHEQELRGSYSVKLLQDNPGQALSTKTIADRLKTRDTELSPDTVRKYLSKQIDRGTVIELPSVGYAWIIPNTPEGAAHRRKQLIVERLDGGPATVKDVESYLKGVAENTQEEMDLANLISEIDSFMQSGVISAANSTNEKKYSLNNQNLVSESSRVFQHALETEVLPQHAGVPVVTAQLELYLRFCTDFPTDRRLVYNALKRINTARPDELKTTESGWLYTPAA